MRQLRRSAVAAIALVILAVSTAEAVSTLYTSAHNRFSREFDCIVVNTGTKSVNVTIQAVDLQGNVVQELAQWNIAPGQGDGFIVSNTTGGPFLSCKFIVHTGNKTTLRASHCVYDAGGICQASSDAR